MPENFRELANKDYPTVKKTLDQNGVKFFGFCGTALGAVRNGNFIKWDYDIDLATIGPWPYEKRQKVAEDFKAHGFDVVHRNPTTDGNIWFQKHIHGDIYWFRKEGDFYIYRLDTAATSLKIPARFFDNLIEKKLGDSTIMVPNPPGPYLRATYDKDWRKTNLKQQGKYFFQEVD